MPNYKKTFLAILIAGALFSFMNKEIAAQKKPAKAKAQPQEQKPVTPPDVSYTVSMSKPFTHLLEVEMRVKWDAMPDKAELKMAVWTPGSYLIREYARHVQDFAVKDAAGADLKWEKINKNTWQIDSTGKKEIVATYKVYSNELTVRTNELNDEHAFWNNAALLMYPKDHIKAPSTVTVKPFGEWKVATGLPKIAGTANSYRAENYDILFDSPFEVSDFKEATFSVMGIPHRLVITGSGNYDIKQIVEDTTKIAMECHKIFGEFPMKDYTIIVNLRGGGGLEHLNSTALQWNKFGFKPRARYNAFLHLVAHEYFHLWNVKRIRPDALGPFDYENENYTKLLWVAEGATAYYESVLLNRAGIESDSELLGAKAGLIRDLVNRPGRFQTSLQEASLDAWIKYYRQDENAINNQISYYDKGEIVNMLLDITIRQMSNGQNSLDTVMKNLYDEFYKKDRNFSDADFKTACETAAGGSLDEFFAKYVEGRDEVDFAGIFGSIGLAYVETDQSAGKAYFGANMTEENGRLNVRTIPAGTPAYDQGINTGDQIVAIDGNRASMNFLQTYLGDKKPGDKVKLTVFRFDTLRDFEITLGSDSRKTVAIAPNKDATPEQRALLEKYIILSR